MPTLTLKKPKITIKPFGSYKKSSKEYKEANKWIKSKLPRCPFAIGILYQLLRIKPDHISEDLIAYLLRNKTSSNKYLKALINAKYRTDLKGKKYPIDDAHRKWALTRLNGRRKNKEDAAKLRKAAELKYGFCENHGK